MNSSWKGIATYSTVGLEFALSILFGLFGGRWLDAKLGAHGVVTFIGLGFGIAAGCRAVYRALQQANREAEEQEKRDREERAKFHEDKDP